MTWQNIALLILIRIGQLELWRRMLKGYDETVVYGLLFILTIFIEIFIWADIFQLL